MGWWPQGSSLCFYLHFDSSSKFLLSVRTLGIGWGPTWIIQDALLNPRYLIIFARLFLSDKVIVTGSGDKDMDICLWGSPVSPLYLPGSISHGFFLSVTQATNMPEYSHPRDFAHAAPSAWISLTLYLHIQICLILFRDCTVFHYKDMPYIID